MKALVTVELQLCSDLFFSFGGSYGVQDKIDVLLQPDLHTTIAVGLAALFLALTDLLSQRQIPCRHVHSFDVIVISAARNVEETAHLTDGILISMTVDHHILNFGLHILSVSERKSRNNSFSIFRRWFSYLYFCKVFAGLRPRCLERPWIPFCYCPFLRDLFTFAYSLFFMIDQWRPYPELLPFPLDKTYTS